MAMKKVYDFSSYKAVMSHYLRGVQNRGNLSKAADFLGCQRSYLSRVLTEGLHITPDHAFNLSRFWQFDADEREYFRLLVECERAADSSYRSFLKQKLGELKKNQESISLRTQRADLSTTSIEAKYFSSWIWSALHFLTSIPDYQTPSALSARLGVSKDTVLEYLSKLKELGFVEKFGDSWKFRSGEFHLDKGSPFLMMHQNNWRMRASIEAQNPQHLGVHYTGVHTLSKSDFLLLKEMLLDFIAKANKVATPSPPEEAIALTCDLFLI